MPCRYEETPAEIEARQEKNFEAKTKPLRDKLDALTHENDQLREIILRIADKDSVPADLWKKIQKDQVEHRKEDLRRLEITFLEEIGNWAKVTPPTGKSYDMLDMYTNLLIKTRNADPKKPLEPQLGFDPDAY